MIHESSRFVNTRYILCYILIRYNENPLTHGRGHLALTYWEHCLLFDYLYLGKNCYRGLRIGIKLTGAVV
jgi:hypothetical protein